MYPTTVAFAAAVLHAKETRRWVPLPRSTCRRRNLLSKKMSRRNGI